MSLHMFDHHAMDDALPKSALLARMQSFPALMALCIQLGTAMLLSLSLVLLTMLLATVFDSHLALPLGIVFLLQAVLSSALSQYFGMASWWKWIHLGFPVFVWLMLMFPIPTEVYLVGFVVTASIYWTSFRTQVPYYPSRLPVWKKVSAVTHQYQAQYGSNIHVMEIGSGLGGFARYIAQTHPAAQVEGIEVAPLPWLVSVASRFWHHSTARFKLGNYEQLDFATYDIVFAYLSPAAMPALWKKSQQQMLKGRLLISLEFPVPDIKPTQHMQGDYQSPDLYLYQF